MSPRMSHLRSVHSSETPESPPKGIISADLETIYSCKKVTGEGKKIKWKDYYAWKGK